MVLFLVNYQTKGYLKKRLFWQFQYF